MKKIALTVLLGLVVCGVGRSEESKEGGRSATMPELIQLAKKEPSAFNYLVDYLLSNELEILTDGPGVSDGKDAEKFKLKVLNDARAGDPALIFTSKRALDMGAGALAIKRDDSGNYPTVTANGREAFMILWSNGIQSAIVNYGDSSSILLDGEDIEILADGGTPGFIPREDMAPGETKPLSPSKSASAAPELAE